MHKQVVHNELVSTLGLVGAAWLALVLIAPWHGMLVPDDEGFEAMKASLWADGFKFYAEIWSDQPPLHTLVLGLAFILLGVGVHALRLVALVFAAWLLWEVGRHVMRSHGMVAACVTLLGCLGSPVFCRCALSCTIMLPAYALGLAAVCMTQRNEQWNWGRSFLIGLLLGAAVLTKFIAIIVVPTLLVCLWRAKLVPRQLVRVCLSGAAGCLMALLLVWGAFCDGAWEQLWQPHLSPIARNHFHGQSLAQASAGYLQADWPWLLLATAGSLLAARRGKIATFLVPGLLLGTAFLVHFWLRPYWAYYYLHLIVPLVWLAGLGTAEGILWAREMPTQARAIAASLLIVGCLLPALASLPSRWNSVMASLPQPDDAQRTALLNYLRQHGGDWILTDQPGLVFEAGLRVPPEAAVLSRKRLELGLFDTTAFLQCVQQRRPGIIAWSGPWAFGPEATALMRETYEPQGLMGGVLLYRRKPGPSPAP